MTEHRGTGRAILVTDTPDNPNSPDSPDSQPERTWIALTVVEDAGAWIERTRRPLDGWGRICQDARAKDDRARRWTRTPTPKKDAVRVAVRSHGQLDTLAQALAEPVEQLATAWETGNQARIHDARTALARATERALRTQSHASPAETVLRSATADDGHDTEKPETPTVARSDERQDEPARHKFGTHHMIIAVIIALTTAMGIQRGYDAMHGIVRAGEWSAQATRGQTRDCRKRAVAALKTLRTHHERALQATARGAPPPTHWIADPTPTTWETLARESVRNGRYVVSADRSRWAQGWLDPASGTLRLVVNRNPAAGTLSAKLSTEGWPECRPDAPSTPTQDPE